MASYKTPNIGLNKWAETDYFKRIEVNENFDEIDDQFSKVNDQIGILYKNVVYVEQFSKIGGETDDAPRIQRAIDYLSSLGGGVLVFSPITYTLSTRSKFDDGFLEPKSNIHYVGYGATLKAGDFIGENFNFFSTNKFLENVTFEGLTFDSNHLKNPLTLGSYHKRAALLTYSGCNNIKIIFCKFRNMSGDQIISINRSPLYPSSMVWIQFNIFYNVGNAIDNNSSDHTSVYLSADNCFVMNNIFYNDYQAKNATPFEAHGSNQWFTDNYIYRYTRVGHVVSATSNGVVEVTRNVNWERNVSVDTYHAVQFWITSDNGVIEHITIKDNKFKLLNPSPIGGHVFDIHSQVLYDKLKGLTIEGNEITYTESLENVSTNTSIIYIGYGNDLKIKGNKINKSAGYCIFIEAKSDMSNIEISENAFYDASLYGGAYDASVALNPKTYIIRGVLIRNNKVKNVESMKMNYAFKFLLDGSKFNDVSIINNETNVNVFPIAASGSIPDCYINDICYSTPVGRVGAKAGSRYYEKSTKREFVLRVDGDRTKWRSISYDTSPPSENKYPWNFEGDEVININPTTGGILKWVCTVGGNPGKWTPIQAGVLNSVSSAPSFIGQIAVVNNIAYIATGTNSASDWKQISN